MKKAIFGISAITLIIMIFSSVAIAKMDIFLQIEVIDQIQFQNLIETRSTNEIVGNLIYGGIEAPFDQTEGVWFLNDQVPMGGISMEEGYKLLWLGNEAFENINKSISHNEIFTLIVYNDFEYELKKVKITSLPIMSIELPQVPTSKFLLDEQWVEHGEISVYGALKETQQVGAKSYQVNMNIRGNTSQAFDKKSYKINIRDEENKPLSVAFTDTWKDNDWILNAIYSDKSRIRETYITDLWRKMLETQTNPEVKGFGMEYVELFINDIYYGIYAITEPIDEKQQALDKNSDFIIKYIEWIEIDAEIIRELKNTEAKEVLTSCFEMEYLPVNSTLNPWLILGECFQQLKKEDVSLEDGLKVIDIENQVDFALLKLYGALVDNDPKNIFYIGEKDENDNYVIHKDIWDVNYVMGDTFSYDLEVDYTVPFEANEYVRLTNELDSLLKGEDGETVKKIIQQRWEFFRSTILSDEEIIKDLDAIFGELESCGALTREENKWQQNIDFYFELNRLKTFALERVVILDEFLTDL